MNPTRFLLPLIFCLMACAGHLGLVIVENDTRISNEDILRAAELVLQEPIEDLSPGLDIQMVRDQDRVTEACNNLLSSGCFTRWLDAWPSIPDRIVVWVPEGVQVWETSLVHELIHRYQFDRLWRYGDGHPRVLFGLGGADRGLVGRIEAMLEAESLR